MTDRGERGPTGDHGQAGEVGATGATGQVGKTGEHGDIGVTGLTGRTGATGAIGPQGSTSEVPFVLRHLTEAFVFLLMGIVAGFGFSEFRSRDALAEATGRLDAKARELCETGNVRSDLQRETLVEQRARTEAFDFRAIVNLPEPERSQVAMDLKQQSLAASDRNIAQVPYIDCKTGKRVPPPPLPPAPPP